MWRSQSLCVVAHEILVSALGPLVLGFRVWFGLTIQVDQRKFLIQ